VISDKIFVSAAVFSFLVTIIHWANDKKDSEKEDRRIAEQKRRDERHRLQMDEQAKGIERRIEQLQREIENAKRSEV
jgi:cell division protein FtsL